jgi:hypothetical protein
MRLSPCLLAVAILSSRAAAFFPYKPKVGLKTSEEDVVSDLKELSGRFFPWVSSKDVLSGDDSGKPPTLNIGKVETGKVSY